MKTWPLVPSPGGGLPAATRRNWKQASLVRRNAIALQNQNAVTWGDLGGRQRGYEIRCLDSVDGCVIKVLDICIVHVHIIIGG